MQHGSHLQTHSKQECLNATSQHKTIRLLVPRSALAGLGPVVDAYYACGHNPEVDILHTIPTNKELARAVGQGPDAVLLLSPARRAPSTLVDGPFLKIGNKNTPIGLFPVQNKHSLPAFAETMMQVEQRKKELLSIALLSQKHPRYSHLVDRMHASTPENTASFRWTSNDLIREDMIKGLGLGLGLSIYFGHGRPAGWVGYYGLRAHHFNLHDGKPLGAMLHLCCLTASRRRVGYSFAEKMVMQGVASASFGAVKPTLHTNNTRWAIGLVNAIQQGAKSLDELIIKATPLQPTALDHYRIIGDPLASIYSSKESVDMAQKHTSALIDAFKIAS